MKKFGRKQKKVRVTIDGLVIITARGFAELGGEVKEVKGELKEVKEGLGEVKGELVEMNRRLNTVEALLASNRIEKFEDRMRVVLTHLKLKV